METIRWFFTSDNAEFVGVALLAVIVAVHVGADWLLMRGRDKAYDRWTRGRR